MLQNIPKSEFLYRTFNVLTARLITALINPGLLIEISDIDLFRAFNLVAQKYFYLADFKNTLNYYLTRVIFIRFAAQ